MRILTMCIFLIKCFTNHPFCVYISNNQRISCNIYITSNIMFVSYMQAVSWVQPSCLTVCQRVCKKCFQRNHLTLQVPLRPFLSRITGDVIGHRSCKHISYKNLWFGLLSDCPNCSLPIIHNNSLADISSEQNDWLMFKQTL